MRVRNPIGAALLTGGLILLAVGTATILAVRRPRRRSNPGPDSRNSYVPNPPPYVRWHGNRTGVYKVDVGPDGLMQAVPVRGYEDAPMDPALELDPEFDWEEAFEDRVLDGLGACLEDPACTTTECAVVVMLETMYPEAGGFALRPGTGMWKRQARERARAALADSLGPDELSARARLCAVVGREARASGSSLDEAALRAAETAWPELRWDPQGLAMPWQHEALRRCKAEIIGHA